MTTEDALLFLDIDGVLNAHEFDPEILCGQIHRDKVSLLNDALRATGAKVVLSSAWRYIVHRGEATLQGMDWLLRSHGMLAGRLIGVTRPDTMMPLAYSGDPATWPVENERGRQISDWIRVHRRGDFSRPYAVVDDLDLGITTAGHPLVLTDGKVGLTAGNAAMLREMLGQGRKSVPPGVTCALCGRPIAGRVFYQADLRAYPVHRDCQIQML